MASQTLKPVRLLGLARPRVLLALVSVLWLVTMIGLYLEPGTRRNVALDRLGLGWSLVLGAVIAVGLGVFMMALNDALDARHDRAFEPDRPIPSGQVTQRGAFGLAMAGLLGALACSVPFGQFSVAVALVTAAAIVFYNVAGRFVPAVGIVTLGLIVGVTALIPNPRLAFAWPILLMMTHVMASAALRHWLAGKRPALTPINGWGVLVGWVFWSLVVLVLIRVRGQGLDYSGLGLVWLGPLIAAVLFLLISWLTLGPSTLAEPVRRRTAARFTRFASVWLIVFNASWLFSAGLWWQGCVVLLLVFGGLVTPSR